MAANTISKGREEGLSRQNVVWVDPERMSGEPCFTRTRVPIRTLFDYLEAGDSVNDFLDSFQGVTRKQVVAALRFGKDQLLLESSKR